MLVEQFAPGNDYRLLVVGGKLVAAARREPAQVVGDGVHTIAELVEIVNMDPRRGEDHATSLSKIQLDADLAGRAGRPGLDAPLDPPAGQRVLIRRNANLSTGGTAIDVTDRVHPEVAARAIEAAQVVGLDIAGVDVVATDISRPLEEQGGVIVEVNAAPGCGCTWSPRSAFPARWARPSSPRSSPTATTAASPSCAVTGVNGKTTTTRFIAHILQGTGRRVGMTCTDGIYIDDRRIDSGDCSGPQTAAHVLMNPAVDAAVLETARGGMLRAGLGFDRCDVAVVTNIGEGDHLGPRRSRHPGNPGQGQTLHRRRGHAQGLRRAQRGRPAGGRHGPHCPGGIFFFASTATIRSSCGTAPPAAGRSSSATATSWSPKANARKSCSRWTASR